MILKKSNYSRLLLVLMLAFLLVACSRAAEQSPTMEGYPAPEQPSATFAYPDPSAPTPETVPSVLNPEIYPAPGKPTLFDPLPEDANLVRSQAEVLPDSAQIFLDEAPVVFLRMTVQVIDLCQQVRVVVNAPQDGKINLEVYSVAEKDLVCAQVLTEIVPTVTLGMLQPGSYEVLVNNVSLATFEVK